MCQFFKSDLIVWASALSNPRITRNLIPVSRRSSYAKFTSFSNWQSLKSWYNFTCVKTKTLWISIFHSHIAFLSCNLIQENPPEICFTATLTFCISALTRIWDKLFCPVLKSLSYPILAFCSQLDPRKRKSPKESYFPTHVDILLAIFDRVKQKSDV